jgi:hypothetical protein
MITAVFNTFSRELKKNMLNTAVVHHTQRSKTLEQEMITAVFNTFSSELKKKHAEYCGSHSTRGGKGSNDLEGNAARWFP